MPELSDADSFQFIKHYIKNYHQKPSWYAASYYDACKVALEAIKKSGIHDAAIGKKRMDIKDALQSMYHLDYAVKGVMGYHFFNQHGDIQMPMKVAKYKKQSLIPGFYEYCLDLKNEYNQDIGKQVLKGDKIIIDQLKMNKTQIVYTGITINHINELNISQQTCMFDFHIWFKYQNDFDPAQIVFENAVEPIKLEKPVVKKIEKNISICSFHLLGTFKQDFDFRSYPFDHQQLAIVYRHKTLTNQQLKLIVDRVDHQLTSDEFIKETNKLNRTKGWELLEEDVYPDIKTYELQTGINKESSFSLIHYKASIKRIHMSGMIRHFYPIVTMIMISCLVIFLPHQKILIKMIIISAILVANAIYHINVYGLFNTAYITAMEYIHIGFYMIIVYIAFASVFLYSFHQKKSQKVIRILSLTIRLLYFFLLVCLGYMVMKMGALWG